MKLPFLLTGLLFASVATALDDLAKQRVALERQLLEYTLASGTTEAAFADEVAELKAKIEAIKKKLSTNFIQPSNQGWFSGFYQVQFTNLQSGGTTTGDFRNRRSRLNYNHLGDEKTMVRAGMEFSAGVNQTGAQIRDAFIQFKPNSYLAKSGPTFTIGQQLTPLGYDISLPSWARLWPERSIYEQAYHNGERGRGFLYQNGDAGNYWFAGLWSSLMVNDFEAVNNSRGPAGEVGPIAGARKKLGGWELGVSALSTRRPRFVSGSTDISVDDRRFSYLDVRYHPANSRIDLRTEIMRGEDRIPGQNYSATNTSGFHVALDYRVNTTDSFVLRHEEWDADTALDGGLTKLDGVAYVRDISQSLRLSLAWQWNTVLGTGVGTPANALINSGQQFTFRVQFRF